MRTASVIELTDEQRQQLQRWTRSSTVSVRLARRARMILLAAEGMDNHRVAAELSVGRVQRIDSFTVTSLHLAKKFRLPFGCGQRPR